MLDNLPLGTLIALAGIIIGVIGYATGDLSFDEAMIAVGVVNTGAGAIGYARAASGKGVRR